MPTVTSADDTAIGYRVRGDGPPVLMVHGSMASSSDWGFVGRLLRDQYTVVTMDRRGRGASDPGAEPYSIEREAEDIAAVAAATGARRVVAHSYGAVCTITALAAGLELDALVLYEPPMAMGGRELEQFAAANENIPTGDLDAAVAMFLRAVGATKDELALIRASAAWPELRTNVTTLAREMSQLAEWEMPAGPFGVPCLFLLGAETTAPVYLQDVPLVDRAFTDLQRATISGQRHLAHIMAADTFAALVDAFFSPGRRNA